MAGSSFGKIFRITTWGESHGPALGCVIDGCPAGVDLSEADIQPFLDRRKPGNPAVATARKESDTCEILSGVFEGKTTGTPISVIIRNSDQHSGDYDNIKDIYRPGHADYTFDAKYGFWGLVILTNWQLIGYMMVIYIAGLQNIPGDLIEAAEIDGASALRVLFRIKIPMVMPSITICTFLTLANTFKMFDQNLALTAGAPEHSTEMLALNIYNTFYGRVGWQGVGQAKAVVFFVIVALIALMQLKVSTRKEVEL